MIFLHICINISTPKCKQTVWTLQYGMEDVLQGCDPQESHSCCRPFRRQASVLRACRRPLHSTLPFLLYLRTLWFKKPDPVTFSS